MSDVLQNKSTDKSASTNNNDPVATITSLTHDGRGVARVNDKVVFIEGALPGEEVVFRYGKKRKKYDQGKLLEILKPSEQRVEPPCEYYGLCGACGLQHLDSAQQIHEKENILREHFNKFGGIAPEQWLPPLSGEKTHYRRKARLGARYVIKKEKVLVGFREKASSYIADMLSCKTLDKRFSDMLPHLRELIMGLSCKKSVPQIEVAAGDDSVALIFRHLESLSDDDSQSLIDFGKAFNANIYVQSKGPDSVKLIWPEQDQAMSYHLPDFDLEMLFRPNDFIQVNADMNRRMVKYALDLLDVQPEDKVLDLFCGLGNFTLPLAKCAEQVVGVEANDSLLEFARQNAEHNSVENVEFRKADLYDEKSTIPWADFQFNKLLIDPPRDGAFHVVKQLPKKGPQCIVYVSCNPITLARDSEYLVNEQGYRMTKAGVMDMFPHTYHVESIAVFVK